MADVVDQGTGRTRWKRFGVVMLPSLAAATALGIMVANGILAASFAVSGTTFKVSATHLSGTEGFQQFGGIDFEDLSPPSGAHPVAVSVIGHAELTDLCQSVVVDVPIPGFPDVTVRIEAGGNGRPAEADNLVVDAETLSGDATFSNIDIGRDASTLDAVSGGPTGLEGSFGQQADTVEIDDLRQTAWATTAGTFKLHDLALSLGTTTRQCF